MIINVSFDKKMFINSFINTISGKSGWVDQQLKTCDGCFTCGLSFDSSHACFHKGVFIHKRFFEIKWNVKNRNLFMYLYHH